MNGLTQKDMNVPFVSRIMAFLFSTILMMVVCSGLVYLLSSHGATTAKMRILTIAQDALLFVSPPIITAIIASRKPAKLLLLNKPGKALPYLLVVGLMLFSIPAMNWLVHFNESLDLPAWAGDKESEAAEGIALMMGGTSVADLIVNLLIIGVAAGFSEELFFRGGLQRLLITRPMNPHVAIWITATVFSAVHLQFYGFIPRLLLGAYFGYLAWWSGTIWLPMAAHILNNSVIVASDWMLKRGDITTSIDDMGNDSVAAVAISAAAVVLMLAVIKLSLGKRYERNNEATQAGPSEA